ncbi:MAG: glycoside hydrolase family 15 protein [Candidatus Saccharibacteria bacterium]
MDNPRGLRSLLEQKGALLFQPYQSGLFPACALTRRMGESTGMNKAWLRDNAHIANAIHRTQPELAVSAGRAMLKVLNNNRASIDAIVDGTHDRVASHYRLPVRVDGDTLANDSEPRVQNDSVGYALWLTSRFINGGAIVASPEDLETLAQTVRYLDEIKFWEDPDDGHWEEERRVHVSSIGAVIAGLKEVCSMFEGIGYVTGIDFDRLESLGRNAMDNILARHATEMIGPPDSSQDLNASIDIPRKKDSSLLFLVVPLGVFTGEQARLIVTGIEQTLVREKGVARYSGDTYWSPGFKGIMSIDQRTTYADGRLEKRNEKAAEIANSGTEAQWSLFDSLLSVYYGRCYEQTGDDEELQKQVSYLNRSLSQLAETEDGRLLMPEAYYYDNKDGVNKLVPNDHIPLLWSQANLLLALHQFETTIMLSRASKS